MALNLKDLDELIQKAAHGAVTKALFEMNSDDRYWKSNVEFFWFDFGDLIKLYGNGDSGGICKDRVVAGIPLSLRAQISEPPTETESAYLGLFVGGAQIANERHRGPFPVRRGITIRIHDRDGHTIKKETFDTLNENSEYIAKGFETPDEEMHGWSHFITTPEIIEKGMLNNNCVCVSLQVSPLSRV